jgi:hypothetical protein
MWTVALFELVGGSVSLLVRRCGGQLMGKWRSFPGLDLSLAARTGRPMHAAHSHCVRSGVAGAASSLQHGEAQPHAEQQLPLPNYRAAICTLPLHYRPESYGPVRPPCSSSKACVPGSGGGEVEARVHLCISCRVPRHCARCAWRLLPVFMHGIGQLPPSDRTLSSACKASPLRHGRSGAVCRCDRAAAAASCCGAPQPTGSGRRAKASPSSTTTDVAPCASTSAAPAVLPLCAAALVMEAVVSKCTRRPLTCLTVTVAVMA